MYTYQLIIITALLLCYLTSFKNKEVLSIVVLHFVSISMYHFISAENYSYYYTIMVFVLLLVGFILKGRFKLAAFFTYTLVPINVVGYFLWYKHYPHGLYDVLSAIMLIAQFLSTLPRLLFDGMDATIDGCSMDGGSNSNGAKKYATMYKTSKSKET